MCEAARRGRAAVGEPALPLLGAVRARLGALLRRRPRRARSRPARRARASAARLAGGTMPDGGRRARAGRSACALLRGRRGRARRARSCTRSASDELAHTIPVERCFDWESLALVELALGDARGAPSDYARRAEEHAAALGLQLPAALAARARAAVLLAARRRARGGRGGRASRPTAADADRRAAPGRVLAQPRRAARSPRPASAAEAIAVLREAERELDACGSVRVRDEMRRELRKLGARAETRGPAAAGDTGVGVADQARARDRRRWSTDRKTNREIAAALFLSDKTVESHMRNIFIKLGVVLARRGRARRRARRGASDARRDRDRAAARRRRRAPGRARLRAGARPRGCASSTTWRSASPAISPVVGLYAVVLVGTVVAGPGVGLGAAGRARRPVPAARGLRRARVGVPDRRRRLPVEPPPDGRRLRLVHRLGRDLRVRGREHDDRLPRRAVGADAARHRADAATRSSSTGMVLVVVCAVGGRARRRRARPGGQGSGSPPRSSRRSGSALALLLVFRDAGLLDPRRTRSAPRRCPGGSVARRRCSPRWPSAAGSSSASTPASARRRRRATPRATCRARSGSRC